ncbi:HAD family hydrolase [Mucilaginibacter sp. UR6-1]|uniref:HAD family hydrolase n=1 Tax=Mucilaginibacter sp. UR6-1 TaxID=1435643 RepID=UPI001E487C7D|nr:HAD family hydrolase [Mucilaginibacter sp. UR6-1]MCC8411099.1 HAD family hydrolase [Mucilaginibacter sp. UR6-1]
MPLYQHYSFDLWLTLIRSNPEFKARRSQYFFEHLNFNNKPLDEVLRIFRQVDLMVNHINEKTGKNIDADEMYLMVISMINDTHECIADIDVEELYNRMEELLFNYLPVVYSPQTMDVLAQLTSGGNSTANILSNTGFIKGVTLRKVLRQLGLDEFFSFQLYSDEAGYSKPHPEFFKLMFEGAQKLHPGITQADIIHIGDNKLADVAGAQACGFNSLLINSTQQTIKNLTDNAPNVLIT